MTTEIHGRCDAGFEPVRAAFEDNVARGEELGARFTLIVEGQTVVDLWAGFADRKREKPFAADTLTPVFSTTKALAALLIARLVEIGELSYDQPVADVWPEFAQAGKGAVTVGQVMSHQAGLPGFLEPMDPALWFDWDAICERLATMTPLWPPGTASGYHAITFGYLAGEIFRRVDGRTMGVALKEDIAEPCGLDLWIGLPDREHGRVADLQRPSALPAFGEVTDPKKAAFLSPWAAPGGRTGADWRRAEIPSANGHATAESLARLMGALAGRGAIDDVHILNAETVAAMSAERIAGADLVLPFNLSWGAGVMRNPPNGFYGPGANTFGHSGWGGSCVFADPDWDVAGAYVMNKQDVHLMGDPRSRRLINAAYGVVRSRRLARQAP
ncbi:CubicO group peptidase (beta-lactamase class C family) [Caulobacter ginsengisoli]|uniref:CubicO group peptidase (Beta-lactamase class C family) n=1 Tax=Caulobacter ginsengisoli TaxID=400775 RepID=A0ABU0IWA2_9CAUL|nr:serine hydrolase domain-containing protein [Caulobacter ginsengisoli]MDQ0465631.1 CubicO group peptidase (beta-lactamase class C family) [Caulobacter ginsengisoli]